MIARNALFIFGLTSHAAFSALVVSSGLEDGSGALPDRAIVTSEGALVATGFAGVGVFSLPDDEVDRLAISKDFAGLIAAFQPVVGTDDFQAGLVSLIGSPAAPGFFYVVNEGIDPVASGLSGATIYSFFGNGPTLAESMELGLFRHSSVLAGNVDGQGNTRTYFFNLSDGVPKLGAFGSTSQVASIPQLGTFDQPFATMVLETIPEPGISISFLAGVSMLAFRCRQRSGQV
ncbi:PEP-CTERM sorting domain-containing protein [Luteolibacter arcticus]|uniref:PEP-CTERM sorting domain-containing protein n=1 Tax=Luteolibacter arcticus TaxID=1581411 RepID=A0ABT3GL80_9BACT|nr:PEP-CTERM sorting domain-containing protein [Luteolibacter arcticus]MCW1924278.1 PEP-CTERM sorting domain-containing protein [Luteolibacter arcticus]